MVYSLHVLQRPVNESQNVWSSCDVQNRFLTEAINEFSFGALNDLTSRNDVQKIVFFPSGCASSLWSARRNLGRRSERDFRGWGPQ